MQSTPMEIFMNKNESCRLLCARELKEKHQLNFKWMIKHEYRISWVVDNLPSAWRQTFYNEEVGGRITHYETGFPLGWMEHALS